jgi:thioredoxin reductase
MVNMERSSTMAKIVDPEALIIGAGPCGIAAALELAKKSSRSKEAILIVDRDDGLGGFPRFCLHPGFGMEYTWRIQRGPAFVRSMLAKIARQPSIRVLSRTTATEIMDGPRVTIVSAEYGMMTLSPKVVLIATGVRESTRAERRIGGHRPSDGFVTTGELQQSIIRGVDTFRGRHALIVGSELVSFSALLSARRAGIRVVGMVEQKRYVQSFRWLKLGVESLMGIPVYTNATINRVAGNSDEIESIEISQGDRALSLVADLLIMTAAWQADSALAESSKIEVEPPTRRIITNERKETSRKGVFAAGNVARPITTAGRCARDGAEAAVSMAEYLVGKW